MFPLASLIKIARENAHRLKVPENQSSTRPTNRRASGCFAYRETGALSRPPGKVIICYDLRS
jgi:hypothetical protein